MIAAITETSDVIPDHGILVDINNKSCMITPDHELPEGWKRISLETALTMVSRSNAEWIIPESSTDGMKKVRAMMDEWFSELRKERETEEPIMTIISDLNSTVKSKSLIDVQKQRKRKNEWKKF